MEDRQIFERSLTATKGNLACRFLQIFTSLTVQIMGTSVSVCAHICAHVCVKDSKYELHIAQLYSTENKCAGHFLQDWESSLMESDLLQ